MPLERRSRNKIRRLSAVAAAFANSAAAIAPESTASTLYWADMNNDDPSCKSGGPPPHLNSDKLFASKALCCQQMLPWLPAEECLGPSSEISPLGTARPVAILASGASTEVDIDCSDPSITRVQCLQAPNCERGTRQASNGLWVSYCAFKDDSSLTNSPLSSHARVRTKRPSAPPSSPSSASPSLFPFASAEVPTYSPTHSHVDATLEPTQTLAIVSTIPSSMPFLENDEPRLYCAFKFSELEKTCSTTAQECGSGPCPPGMFCFPYDCMVAQSSLLHDEAHQTIVASSSKRPSAPFETTSYSPSFYPMHPSRSPLSFMSPSKLSPMSPNRPSPSTSPAMPYSTSDFIIELVEWSNIGITDSSTQIDDVNKPRTFPTLPPSISPSKRPTSYPTILPTTSEPTERKLPVAELILPSVADTTLSNARPDDNFGKLEAIAINGGSSNKGNDRFDSLIKFDLSLMDRSCTVVSATLKVFSVNSCSGGSNVYVTEDSAWDEETATWNNAPAAQGVRIAILSSMSSNLWQNIDVTSAVNVWNNEYHTDDSLSLRIMSSENSLCMFAASESGEQTQARLVVEYTVNDGSLPIQQMYGSSNLHEYPPSDSQGQIQPYTNDVHELSTSLSKKPTTVNGHQDQEFSELVLIATADSSVSNIRQSSNFGTQNEIVVDGGDYGTGLIRGSNGDSEQFDALLKFDTSTINDRAVELALLRIHVISSCSYGGDIYVTTGHDDWNQETVTWNDAPQASGRSIGSLSSVEAGHWYSVELTIVSDTFSSDQVTLRVESPENSRCMYTSLDRGIETAPRLVLRLNSTAGKMDDITPYNNISTPLKPTQELIPVSGNFILIVTTDDATIDATSVDANLGSSPYLSVDYNELTRTIHDIVIRFDLSQMHGGALPRSALLTLFTERQCGNAGTFMTTEGDGEWDENNISWASAPNYLNKSFVGGNMVGTFGEVASGRWYGFSVIEALTEAVLARKKALTFRLTSGGMKSCSYSSLQSGRPPKLLVAF